MEVWRPFLHYKSVWLTPHWTSHAQQWTSQVTIPCVQDVLFPYYSLSNVNLYCMEDSKVNYENEEIIA